MTPCLSISDNSMLLFCIKECWKYSRRDYGANWATNSQCVCFRNSWTSQCDEEEKTVEGVYGCMVYLLVFTFANNALVGTTAWSSMAIVKQI